MRPRSRNGTVRREDDDVEMEGVAEAASWITRGVVVTEELGSWWP